MAWMKMQWKISSISTIGSWDFWTTSNTKWLIDINGWGSVSRVIRKINKKIAYYCCVEIPSSYESVLPEPSI